MKQYYESEVLFQLMERDGLNIPSSVPPYESEIKAYLINQVKQAYPKLTDYEAEWLLYNYTKHLPAEFPISSVSNVTEATFENVVPFAYQSAILKGSTKYRDIDTGDVLDTFDETKNLELVSVKMAVLQTTGKNLFNGWALGEIDDTTGMLNPSSSTVCSDFIKINGYGTYASSNNSASRNVNAFLYDENKNLIKRVATALPIISISEGAYVRLSLSNNNNDKYQFEKGSTITPYEPYKTNILKVNEEVELRKVGNVQDELNCLTGELTQRVGEIVLDGSERWSVNATLSNGIMVYVCQAYTDAKNESNNLISPTVPNYTLDYLKNLTTLDGLPDAFITTTTTTGKINLAFKTPFSDTNQLKQWLSQNTLTIQYQLATESIKTVDLTTVNEKGETTYFMPLEETMHVQSSGEIIQPTFDMTVPVEATTQNLASFIDLETEE